MGLTLVTRPGPQTDAELIASCVAGDPTAQRILFRREYDRVHATVYRLIGSSRDADDLVQETFIAVFRGLAKFRGDARMSTWIDRIAVRVVFHHIRRRGKTPLPLDVVDEVTVDHRTPDARAHARDGLRRLYGVLGELSSDARIAFALHAIDGRSIREVAAITGTTVVTAKLRIWRARRRVRECAAGDPVLAELVRDEVTP